MTCPTLTLFRNTATWQAFMPARRLTRPGYHLFQLPGSPEGSRQDLHVGSGAHLGDGNDGGGQGAAGAPASGVRFVRDLVAKTRTKRPPERPVRAQSEEE